MVASQLSPCVKALGFTGSPLPLDEWLKLRETILSSPDVDTSVRIFFPPVIVSCACCGTAAEKMGYEVVKAIKRGHRDFYCGKACSESHHAIKHRRKCRACGKPTHKKTSGYCVGCRPKRPGRKTIYLPVERICPMCSTPFLARWRGQKHQDYATYCGKSCAERGHSRLMAGVGNPKWKHGATPLREQPHSAKAFRTMRPLIRERDGHKCVVCSATKSLHVHHIDNWPMNNASSNLVTLCATCHRKWHAAIDSKPSTILWPWLIEYAKRPLFSTSKSPATITSLPMASASTTAF